MTQLATYKVTLNYFLDTEIRFFIFKDHIYSLPTKKCKFLILIQKLGNEIAQIIYYYYFLYFHCYP